MTRRNYLALLSALAAETSDPDRVASIVGKLADQGEIDPELAVVAQYLAQQRKERPVDDPSERDAALEWRPWRDERPSARDLLPRIRRLLCDMRSELVELREANDSLARALGACYLCWGGEPSCPACAGHGEPGSFEPDRELFNDLIEPAVRRLRTSGKRDGVKPAEGRSPAGETK